MVTGVQSVQTVAALMLAYLPLSQDVQSVEALTLFQELGRQSRQVSVMELVAPSLAVVVVSRQTVHIPEPVTFL